MTMKRLTMILVAAAAIAADAEEAAFNFQGRLSAELLGAGDFGESQTLVFNVYTNRTGGSSLWRRRVPVALSRGGDGHFSVKLSDTVGIHVQGDPQGSLREAMALGWESPEGLYVGVSVQKADFSPSAEFEPRTAIRTLPTANCAIFAEKPAKDDFTVGGALAAGSLSATRSIATSNLTVHGQATVADLQTKTLYVADSASVLGDVKAGRVYAEDVRIGGDLVVGGSVTTKQAHAGRSLTVGSTCALCAPGMIMMWAGAPDGIPGGWEICDGHTSRTPGAVIAKTPDLTGRFIKGASAWKNEPDTGGFRAVSLDVENLPSHNHAFTFHWHGWLGVAKNSKYATTRATEYPDHKGWGLATSSWGGSDGSCGMHENRPPYYALYYIIKVK